MRVLTTTLENIGPHEYIHIDWTTHEGLVAFLMTNGWGKTFLVEGAFAAPYGKFPSYKGDVYSALRLGSNLKGIITSTMEVDGEIYEIIRRVNGAVKNRYQEQIIRILGTEKPLAGPKQRDFDPFIEDLIGDADLAEATWFSAYRSEGDLCELRPGERSDLIAEFIKTADITAIGKEAKKMRERRETESSQLTTRIRDRGPTLAIDYDTATNEIKVLEAQSETALQEESSINGKLNETNEDLESLASKIESNNRTQKARQHRDQLTRTIDHTKSEIRRLGSHVSGRETLRKEREDLSEIQTEYDRIKEAQEWRAKRDRMHQKSQVARDAVESSREQLERRAEEAEKALETLESDNPYEDIPEETHDDLERLSKDLTRLKTISLRIREIEAYERELDKNRSIQQVAEDSLADAEMPEEEIVDIDTVLTEHRQLTESVRNLARQRTLQVQLRDEIRRKVMDLLAKVRVLEERKKESAADKKQVMVLSHQILNYRILEDAFSRSGIQALLVEAAIKPFELKASEMMQAATEGKFDVRLETLKENRDGTFKEVLSIIIADKVGERDVYQFSGGERRILSSIIRLALSRWIAERSGHRFGTIFVDEAFDSLGPEFREQLIQMFENVSHFFDNIILVTPDPADVISISNRISIGQS
jgi:DNA repair exonuclease SbcCD ATPase subunit